MADTTDFRNGYTLKIDGSLFSIVEFQHVKPRGCCHSTCTTGALFSIHIQAAGARA